MRTKKRGIRVDLKAAAKRKKEAKLTELIDTSLSEVKDTDIFYLFRLYFNCSDNKGARSINRASMIKLLDIYDELGELAETINPNTGMRYIEDAIEDEFKLSILDRVLLVTNRKKLPSKIKEQFISIKNYNYIQRMQNRFSTAIQSMSFPFRLGNQKNSTFFYVLSNDEYQKIIKPITDEEKHELIFAYSEAIDKKEDPIEAIMDVCKPFHLESLQWVLEHIKDRIRESHGMFFYGRPSENILDEITISKAELPQYKPVLGKTNEHLQALYYSLQNSFITSLLEKLVSAEGKLTDKNISTVNSLIARAEKVNILGDPGLLDMIKEIRLKLKAGGDTKLLQDYIQEQNAKIKRKSGVKVSFKQKSS